MVTDRGVGVGRIVLVIGSTAAALVILLGHHGSASVGGSGAATSIAAGVTLARLEVAVGAGVPVVRAMAPRRSRPG